MFSATLSLDFDRFHLWNLRCPKLFKPETIKNVELLTNQNNTNESNIKDEQNNEMLEKNVDIVLPKNLKHQVVKFYKWNF